MAQINEKETSFELVVALLKYIETLQVAGAVLVFLPGWNLIYSMQRHLETNPHFGMTADLVTLQPTSGGCLTSCSLCFQEVTATASCHCTRRSRVRSRGGCLSQFPTTSPRFFRIKLYSSFGRRNNRMWSGFLLHVDAVFR